MSRIEGSNITKQMNSGLLRIAATDTNAPEFTFKLKNIPYNTNPKELYLFFKADFAYDGDHPAGTVRNFDVYLNDNSDWRKVFFSKGHRSTIPYTFYFANTTNIVDGSVINHSTADTVEVSFTVEGSDPVWIHEMTVYQAPEVVYREFENGVVIANLAEYPVTLNLTDCFGIHNFRHLNGQDGHDRSVNVGGMYANCDQPLHTVPAKDAIFLIKE